MELIIADLDRANHQAEAALKEAEGLRSTILQHGEGGSDTSGDKSKDHSAIITGLEAELTRKEREISQLTSDLTATEDKNTIELSQLNRQMTGKSHCAVGVVPFVLFSAE